MVTGCNILLGKVQLLATYSVTLDTSRCGRQASVVKEVRGESNIQKVTLLFVSILR